MRLYDWRHSGVEAAAERMRDVISKLAEEGSNLDFSVREDSIYIDGARVKESGSASLAFHKLAKLIRAASVKSCQIDPDGPVQDIQLLGHLLLAVSEGRSTANELVDELTVRGAAGIEVIFVEPKDETPKLLEGKELQRRVYVGAIAALKGVFHESQSKNRINARRVKRVVQQMMESVESDAAYALNLTSIKNHDEYTFNHSVNVGVLAIALGRGVGLSRRQLFVLGQAGMLHDLGKLCIPRELLLKPGRLTPEERKVIQTHPGEGFFAIASKQGVTSETIAVALGAYEHHLNLDNSGYPEAAVVRPIGLLSRIVAIVDRYDAMTSARVYRKQPILPPKALSILCHTQERSVDQVLLRYFMNMLGQYPLGTLVRLSDNSVGIVVP